VGYGDVLERDPALVIQDLQHQIISAWAAKKVYHVVYDPITFVLDEAETRIKREAVRKVRIKKGLDYESFNKEWTAQKPSEPLLKYYGHWPKPNEE
jgi:hypothetical protein